MYYYPKKEPKKATICTLASFGVAAVLYALGDAGFGYRAVFQVSALLVLSVGIMLLSRYVLTDYKYVISDAEDSDKTVNFVIVKVSGKREVQMAQFDMTGIYACMRCRSVRKFESSHGKVDKVFNYCSNLSPKDEIQLAMTFNGKKILFRLEGDDRFLREIRRITDAAAEFPDG